MELTLDNIQLHRLADLSASTQSDVWNRTVTFRSGQRVLIKAASGVGKSSLISLLYGLTVPHDGSYLIDGIEPEKQSATQLSQLRATRMSIVFQDLRLMEQWTVRENLMVKERLSGIEPGRIEQFCTRLEIDTLLDRALRTLSLGQQQRVAIVRALLQPFDMLLMDEPFSHIDPENMRKACALIDDVAAIRKAGMVITSLDEIYPLNIDTVLCL